MSKELDKRNKLYILEYTGLAPIWPVTPFELVGFDCKTNLWTPDNRNQLVDYVQPELEIWRPDIVFFWMSRLGRLKLKEEPEEWLTLRQHLREHSRLRHTKIMALFSSGIDESVLSNLEFVWNQRYDFFDLGYFRSIEHPRVAKQLVGQTIKGFEGVNEYLIENGIWKIQDYPKSIKKSFDIICESSSQEVAELFFNKFIEHEQIEQCELQPNAMGAFARPPLTRVLTMDQQSQPAWIKGSIQAQQQTYIVYIVKDLQFWEKGLEQEEIEWLGELADKATSDRQLLIGVNEILLQAKPNAINQVLQQVQNSGGWQIFINEHMWIEGFSSYETFEKKVYQD